MTNSSVASNSPSPAPRALRSDFWLELVGPLLLYGALAFMVGLRQSEKLNPDGVCYLRMAGYLAGGDLTSAISTYWSPLFSWSIAPLLWLGVEGLDAARLMQIFWGASLLAAFWWFLRAWTKVPSWARMLAMGLAIMPVVGFEIFSIAPDVALATALLCYFAALGSSHRRQSTLGLVQIGFLGGIAFWFKAYALPFVLLHLPLSIFLLPEGGNRSRRARAALTAVLAFALPVALWLSALAWKTGGLTLGASGAINHAVVGPPDKNREHPLVYGVPKPPHISIWETPERLPYEYWSPFQSADYMRHQVHLAVGNASRIMSAAANLDRFYLLSAALILLLPVGWLLKRDPVTRSLLWWSAGSIFLYLGGYLLVAFEPRYANSLLFLLLLAAVVQILFSTGWRKPRWATSVGLLVLSASILWRWIPATERNLTELSPPYMRELAADLLKLGFRGPFASTSWFHGLALAYFTGQATVGFPPDASPENDAKTLRDAGVDWIVVWEMGPMPPLAVQDMYPPTIPRAAAIIRDEGGWQLRRTAVVSFGQREATIYAFQRTKPPAP